jgi:hypothetical protein
MAISVNMLSRIVTSERQPRSKNGQPPHSTTGADSTSCSHWESRGAIRSCGGKCSRCGPMASTSTGSVSTAPIQSRRVMSRSSGLGPASAVTVRGSSAMPQIGQLPG